jgi:quercetin dioxygenase-like cupin family protein
MIQEVDVSKEPFVLKQEDAEVLRVLGCEVRFLCRGERTGKAWSVMECVTPRDAGPPPHHHVWDEGYFIVAGQLRFSVDGRETIATAGDFVYVPGGTLHGFAGASEEPARVLIFDAPSTAEGFFRDAAREVRELPGDLGKVPGIGARHGIAFAPPK